MFREYGLNATWSSSIESERLNRHRSRRYDTSTRVIDRASFWFVSWCAVAALSVIECGGTDCCCGYWPEFVVLFAVWVAVACGGGYAFVSSDY